VSNVIRTSLAALVLSAAGLVGIVSYEGYTDRAITPVKGDKPTNGFGSTGPDIKLGDKTTPPKALARAMSDIQRDERTLKGCISAPLTQYEYDAYLSLTYNVGASAFCNSTLARKLNARDYRGACDEILRWRFFQGKDCRLDAFLHICGGLWNRRQAEHAQCIGERP